MLKPIKYEFIKTRVLLFIIALAFIILEGTFIYSIITKNALLTANADNFMFGCIILSFCAIAVTSIFLLRRDMNNKTGYLTFMTPKKVSSIVISKLTCAMLSIIGVMAISGFLLKINHPMIAKNYEIYGDVRFFTYDMFTILEFDEANIIQLLGFALTFLFSCLAILATLYFTTTVSNILSKNSIFYIITLAFTIGFIFILITIYNNFFGIIFMFDDPYERYGMLPGLFQSEHYDIHKNLINNLPFAIFQLLISTGCIWGCSRMIDEKLSM